MHRAFVSLFLGAFLCASTAHATVIASGDYAPSGSVSDPWIVGGSWGTNNLDIGINSAGSVTVSNGGEVYVGDDTTLGVNAGSQGTLTVSGTGSRFETGDFFDIGGGGNGHLSVLNGGRVDKTQGYYYTAIGADAGSTGTALVDGGGSTLNLSGLRVGDDGTGSLTIRNGGRTTVNSTAELGVSIGRQADGEVIVDGAGSQLSVDSELSVGDTNPGDGSLHILNGARADSGSGGVGLSGTAVIRGHGSEWRSGASSFGFTVSGSLDIADGGRLTVIENPDEIFSNRAFHTSGGTVNIENGGILDTGNGGIQGADGRTGRVTVAGSGSQWHVGDGSIHDQLTVGDGGELEIRNGGYVSSGRLSIAGGTVTLGGGSPLLDANDIRVTENGLFNVGGNTLDNGVRLNNGRLTLQGGAVTSANLRNGSRLSGHGDIDSVALYTGSTVHGGTGANTLSLGSLRGSGELTGNITASVVGAGTYNQAGELSFENLTLTDGAFVDMELGGLERGVDYDALNIAGTGWLDGRLNISLLDEFNPLAGATFDLFDFDPLNVLGEFDEILLPELGEGLLWDLDSLYQNGAIAVASAAAPVPESAAWLLLMTAFGSVGVIRRRRR